MRIASLSPDLKERYALVRDHVKEFGDYCSKRLGTKVRFRLHRARHKEGFYVYIESENGRDQGRVTFRVDPRTGKPYISEKFVFNKVVKRALKDATVFNRKKGSKH